MLPYELAILVAYYAALILLVAFGTHRLLLTWDFLRRGDEVEKKPEGPLPTVTVQLPMYNERYVAERIIRATAVIDYPSDRFEIQVLDDSTDDAIEVVRRVVESLQDEGVNIHLLHRTDRTGYKAGALEEGLKTATGELIAIFDADFVPDPDYLVRAVGHFSDPKVGMVQGRWGHLNRQHSLMTRVQSVLLDGHFVVEQPARCQAGHFFNFNGTAGIWRKAAIADAGGWEHDTLTEDLDLSYRAQLKGWRFVYLSSLVVMAELPPDIAGFRSQQHRWAKGGIECGRKLLGGVLRANIPVRTKLEAFVHLSANMSYPLLLLLGILMPLMTIVRQRHHLELTYLLDLPLLILGTASMAAFYVTAQRRQGQPVWMTLIMLPFVVAVDIGLSVHKTRAVLEALIGHKTAFVRTPKFGVTAAEKIQSGSHYVQKRLRAGVLELAMAAWCMFGVTQVYSGPYPSWSPLPFMIFFFVGYSYTGSLALLQASGLLLRGPRTPLLASGKNTLGDEAS